MVDQTHVEGDPAQAPPTRPRSGGAHARPEPAVAERPPQPASGHRSFWLELPVLLVVAFLIAFLVKTFLVQAFFIPSGSMEQALQVVIDVLKMHILMLMVLNILTETALIETSVRPTKDSFTIHFPIKP